jgi:hypothetical protein
VAVLKRKSRMISLRLSNEEYESLRSLYRVHGSRSVSEFARTSMQKVISETMRSPSETVDARLKEIDQKMVLLDQEMNRLITLIESRIPPLARSASDAG